MVCARHKDSRLVAAGIAIPAVILAIVGFAVPVVADAEWISALGLNLERDRALRFAWYALFCGGFLTIWNLYRLKRTATAIETLSLTVLILVFVAGLAIRSLNSGMGYRAITASAIDFHEANPSAKIMTWRINRPENIDVYLKDIPFRIVEDSDSITSMPITSYPAIVMTRRESLEEIPNVQASQKVGNKYVVVYCDTIENTFKAPVPNE